jgi:superfamily II DNA or RNA helicase
MKPYIDQQKSIDEIFLEFKSRNRLLYALPTGGGKTAIFSFIAKRFIKECDKKVLVLAHRTELIDQTLNTLRTIGVTCESVIASKRTLHNNSKVYVSMVQTLKNRLRVNPLFLQNIGLIIVDEAHLNLHKEVLSYFNCKILAVTATPVSLKKINFTRCHRCKKEYDTVTACCNYETYEYSRKFSYSEIYQHIILGQSISELIINDRLVRDLNYQIGGCNRSDFNIDEKTGDFDTESTNQFFGQPNVVKNYDEICKGEKTIVFNSSTKTNLLTYESFINAGYENVRMLDSVNTKQSERKPILKWFKDTPNAILLNCGVLTTGFDEPSIQAVIMNRATLSLALWQQCVGRGGRKCETIYKPTFKVIDLGGNIESHGKWSDEVDWKSIFYGSNEKPKIKKEVLDQTKNCNNCGAIISRTAIECPFCGIVEEPINYTTISQEVATLIDQIPMPDGRKIVAYVQKIDRDKNFAWVILQNQIIDIFIRHSVTFGMYTKAEKNGKFEISIRNIIKEPYLIIQCSKLEGTNLRTKAYIINKIKNKLDAYYSRK